MRVHQEVTVIYRGELVLAVVLSLPTSYGKRFEWRESNDDMVDESDVPADHYFQEGTARVDLEGITWADGWEEETGVMLQAAFALWNLGGPRPAPLVVR